METVEKNVIALGSAPGGSLSLPLFPLSVSLPAPERVWLICPPSYGTALCHRGAVQLWPCLVGKFNSGVKQQKAHCGHELKPHPSGRFPFLIKWILLLLHCPDSCVSLTSDFKLRRDRQGC